MKQKGFTLVELLATLVVMLIIAVVTTLVVVNVLDNSSIELYDKQVSIIEDAAMKWSLNNTDMIGENIIYCLPIEELCSSGFLENNEILDPRYSTPMTGYVRISFSNTYNQYIYEYMEECTNS